MNYSVYIALIPLLPLLVFVLLGLWGKKVPEKIAGIFACAFLLFATILSLYTAYQYFLVNGLSNGVYQTIVPLHFTWLQFSPGVAIDMGIFLDPISVMMLVVITVVSLMVHIFSLGYMKGEARFATYFAFLGLFTFSMLGLVLSSNLFQMYMFWELVGVSSYLLIGFYFQKPSAVLAAKKAFVVTRLADFGFLIGILILAYHAKTLDFHILLDRLGNQPSDQFVNGGAATFMGASVLTWALVLIFMGGAGKSAMFPLHVWLPDAMEGPTPVSALIHAATMVVAGVYLIARMFPIYAITPYALQWVTWVGAFSALFAAIVACTQTDIKRVLAYSTMSQIGFMMFSLGVAGNNSENALGYTASMFHLFTHAFFKSLLFLAAGAVIHAVHSNEMKDMGGLRKQLPITHIGFLIACLAISGIPPFAGFFSKEAILLAAWENDKIVYAIGLLTSGITAFYMFRLYFSIFWGRASSHPLHGEGNWSMKGPLILLAAISLGSGFIPFSKYISANGIGFEMPFHLLFALLPVLLGVVGIALAYKLYHQKNERPAKIASTMGAVYVAASNKFYIDEGYRWFTKNIVVNGFAKPAAWIDKNIIDGLVNGIASVTHTIASYFSGIQSGKLQQYVMFFFVAVMSLAVLILYFLS